jgi:predicted O-methyltransferase YrrM
LPQANAEEKVMTTLTTVPVAPLLDRLFKDAEAAHPMNDPAFASVSNEERLRLMRSKADYRHFYAQLRDYALPVSRDTGRLLYMLARATGARAVVEFGASFGLSTLHLAAALRDNSGGGGDDGGAGRLITTEFEPSKIARARDNLAAGGLSDLVEIREGDALETLASGLPDTIDLLLLDGAKSLYRDVLGLVESRLRTGAVIIADNADHCPDYLEYVSEPENGYLTMSFTDEVELTIRLG